MRTHARHVVSLRQSLAKRAAILAAAINDAQPSGTPPIVHVAPAGYFLWVDTRGADAMELQARCKEGFGVTFLPGNRCTLDGAAAPHRARVCFVRILPRSGGLLPAAACRYADCCRLPPAADCDFTSNRDADGAGFPRRGAAR